MSDRPKYATGGLINTPIDADAIPIETGCSYIVPRLTDKQRRRLTLDQMALECGPDEWADNQGDDA